MVLIAFKPVATRLLQVFSHHRSWRQQGKLRRIHPVQVLLQPQKSVWCFDVCMKNISTWASVASSQIYLARANFLWLITIIVNLLAAILSAGPIVASTILFWKVQVPRIPATWIVTCSPSRLSFSDNSWSTHVCDEPLSYKTVVSSWDPEFP